MAMPPPDAGSTDTPPGSGAVEERRFHGRTAPALATAALTTESRAALGQFGVERLMAYGLRHADAVELRGRVGAGTPWRDAALALAAEIQATIAADATASSRIDVMRRASALMRMAQIMMIDDSEARRAIFAAAARLYGEAAVLAGGPDRREIATAHGPLVAWIHRPRVPPIGTAIVIGGIEGWAMDFDAVARALAARGVEAWAVDGPGQGETRFGHGHYLHAAWRETLCAVIDDIERTGGGRPIGIVGNSVGGTLALELAAHDDRLDFCCANGGPISGATILGQQEAKVPKKRMMCGPKIAPAAADAIWAAIDLEAAAGAVRCPVLLLHGRRDPLIEDAEMERLLARLASRDKAMIAFSDGDHCLYNHAEDARNAMADWVVRQALRLAAGDPAPAPR